MFQFFPSRPARRSLVALFCLSSLMTAPALAQDAAPPKPADPPKPAAADDKSKAAAEEAARRAAALKALQEALQQGGNEDKLPAATPEMIAAVKAKMEHKDIKTAPSGLKHIDEVEGTGNPVVSGDIVEVNYTGWLTNGQKFDTSLSPNRAPLIFEIGAGQVIKGWEQGIVGMKPGGKRTLILPSKLGYGEQGQGSIPPGATLVFDVHLLSIPKVSFADVKAEGKGEAVAKGMVVKLQVTGKLADGKSFFATAKDQPLLYKSGFGRVENAEDLAVGAVAMGLNGMKMGDVRKVTVPPALGFGAQGMTDGKTVVPPNAVLEYEVVLMGILKPTIEILKPGKPDGAAAADGDIIEAHVVGKVTDGKEIVNSRAAKPLMLMIGSPRFLEGLNQGLIGMKIGETRKLTLPPELAFGAQGSGDGTIPANATVVFEIDLVNIPAVKTEDLAPGTGETVAARTKNVKVAFSSVKANGADIKFAELPGLPDEFIIGGQMTIPGLSNGVTGMKVGGKRRITVPAILAYGERGFPPRGIPADALLVIELELKSVE